MVPLYIPVVVVPWILAAVHIVSDFHNKGRQERRELLHRIDRQLELYGGVWARLYTSNQMFVDFTRMEGFNYPEELSSFKEAVDSAPQSLTSKRYRVVMKDILGPLQQETIDMIANNFALMREGSGLVYLFLDYLAFVNSYKVLFSRWDSGDYSAHFSSRRFPSELLDCLEKEYQYVQFDKFTAVCHNLSLLGVVYINSELQLERLDLQGKKGSKGSIKTNSYRPAYNPYYDSVTTQ